MAAARKEKRRAEIAKYLRIYRELGAPENRNPQEQAVWAILARHGTREGATRALAALNRRFVDINEFRVAKATEIAGTIQGHVKNDPYRVARQAKGYLWRFHKDHHTFDFDAVDPLTADKVGKYAAGAEEWPESIALALFMHFARKEIEQQAAEAAVEAEGGKVKKRTEREMSQVLDRLRVLCAVACYGKMPAKRVVGAAARQLVKSWSYAPLPPEPAPAARAKAAPKPASKASPRKATTKKKKVVAKKVVKKKAATKKAGSKAASRGGGAARPRTTRAARKRSSSKKSSRR